MSEAIELYKKDGSASGVFYCSDCRSVYAEKERAENCHSERLCACGRKIERRYYALCNECDSREHSEKMAAKERERFDKAQKITEAEYQGDKVFDSDNYYDCVEDAIDGYIEGQEPEYVWACKDVGIPKASSEGILEHILENMWEDAEASDLYGVDELDAAIAAFNKANENIAVYLPDYSTAILVGERTP